ncbi:hypothetical protein [Lysinibacillus sp. NPDC047702]|uniref:hypothetical protein n=1 Tax=unclassified Lysinibacillus TaxID=2636778 RepID=UPI003D08A787
MLDVREIPIFGHFEGEKTPQEHVAEIIKAIGEQFIEKADVMASDIAEDTVSMSINIDLKIGEVVTVNKTTESYLQKRSNDKCLT